MIRSSEQPFASASISQSSIKSVEQLVERQVLEVVGGRVSLGASQLEQLVDEDGEPADVALDAAQVLAGFVAGAGQIDGDVEPGQGGAQLV